MRVFSCSKFILFMSKWVLAGSLLNFFVMLMFYEVSRAEGWNWPAAVGVFYLMSFPLLIALRCNRAFYRVTLDKDGISNRYKQIAWEDTHDYHIIELITKHPVCLNFKEDIICFGGISSRSFFKINPRKTVYLELNEKTIALIRSYAGDKSPV